MPRRPSPSVPLPGRLLGLLALAAGGFTPGPVLADEAILSGGVVAEGNVMLIGDPKQWDTFVGTEPVSSASGFLSVEPATEEGAVEAAWNGEGMAQFFIAHSGPTDYSSLVEADSGLVMVMRVDKKPTKKTTIRMGCGYPCGSDANISKLLKALPAEQWVRFSIDLKCFADGGLDVKNVDTPLLISTKGSLGLSIADVSVVTGAGPEATIRCRD